LGLELILEQEYYEISIGTYNELIFQFLSKKITKANSNFAICSADFPLKKIIFQKKNYADLI
jgi:hypothetical protein